MDLQVKFSILINLFNKDETILKTIESALAQTYRNFEIIVIDFGSTDESLLTISEIKNDKLKIFSSKNFGISKGKNYLSECSQGRFLIFLDADDFWCPDYLQEISLIIERHNPKILSCSYRNQPKSYWGSNTARLYFFKGSNYLLARLLGFGVQTSFVCIRRDVFINSGGFPFQVESFLGYKLQNKKKTIVEFRDFGLTDKNFVERISIPGPGGEDQWLHDNLILLDGLLHYDKIMGEWRNDVDGQASKKYFSGLWPLLFIDRHKSSIFLFYCYLLHQVFSNLKGYALRGSPSSNEISLNLNVPIRFVNLYVFLLLIPCLLLRFFQYTFIFFFNIYLKILNFGVFK